MDLHFWSLFKISPFKTESIDSLVKKDISSLLKIIISSLEDNLRSSSPLITLHKLITFYSEFIVYLLNVFKTPEKVYASSLKIFLSEIIEDNFL